MPAIITHHIFAEELIGLLPEGLVASEEEKLAFILGNQGPDPFFARFTTSISGIKRAQKLAHSMHEQRMSACFLALRACVSHLSVGDERVGRAFALGMLGHWQLDAVCHPFIYAQQYALSASDKSLASCESEIHALIESDIDSWMLWTQRHGTVEDYPPANELARTSHIDQVAGALIAQTAFEVFGINIAADEYGLAVADFELMYKAIEPAGSSRSLLLASIERLFRDSSRLLAQAHKVTKTDECAAANLNHAPWTDPDTKQLRSESFNDLIDQAKREWPHSISAFIQGDEEALKAHIAGRNYNGVRVADE